MFGLTPYNRKSMGITGKNAFREWENVFDSIFNDAVFPGFLPAHPVKADIRENEKEYIVDVEIPGAKKEDIRLELRDDILTVSVERNEEENEERENYIRRERRYGSVSRSFQVENVKNESVTARYDNGVLTVVLPKDEKAKENRHSIEIQ